MVSKVYPQTSVGQGKSERIRSGLNRARAEGKQIGRPRVTLQHEMVVELRRSGHSWAEIARMLHAGAGTVRRAFRDASDAPQPCQNPSADIV